MNTYFNFTSPLVRHTTARSVEVNAIAAAIAAGFDKLPDDTVLKNNRLGYCVDATNPVSPNTVVLTPLYAVLAYVAGQVFWWKPTTVNSGAVTVNLGPGAVAIKRLTGTDLVAGDLATTAFVQIGYNGTNFVMMSATAVDIAAAALSAAAAAASAGAASISAGASAASATASSGSATAAAASALSANNATKKLVQLVITDPRGSAIATGDGQLYYGVPPEFNGMTIISPGASLKTVSSSGLPTIQLRRVRAGSGDADVLSTKITIDANEIDSSTAATPPVVNGANATVLTGDQIHVDIDGAGTGAIGLNVRWGFQ